MRYRINHLYRISTLIGDGVQTQEFDAPDDETARLHLTYELQHSWADELVLERIDRVEITTELESVYRADSNNLSESEPQ